MNDVEKKHAEYIESLYLFLERHAKDIIIAYRRKDETSVVCEVAINGVSVNGSAVQLNCEE